MGKIRSLSQNRCEPHEDQEYTDLNRHRWLFKCATTICEPKVFEFFFATIDNSPTVKQYLQYLPYFLICRLINLSIGLAISYINFYLAVWPLLSVHLKLVDCVLRIFSILSNHFLWGLPFDLQPAGLHFHFISAILSSFILSRCPSHQSCPFSIFSIMGDALN